MASESVPGTQTVERAMSLLARFTEEASELRVSELCTLTGLGQSTVSRMMSSLERMRFVIQDERTGLYRLGPAAVALGTVALNGSQTFRASRQIAQNLAHRVGLGANVARLDDKSLFYLCNFEGPNAPKAFSMAGRKGPLHATGLGKALMSGMDQSALDAYFDGGKLQRFTPHTIVGRVEMDAALGEVRSRGFATEIEELAFGRACLAAPIRNRAGATVAALSVSGPLSVIDIHAPQELALQVVEAADEVSIALGYSPSGIATSGAVH